MNLSPGEYSVEVSRGPEYIVQTHSLTVKPGVSQKADYKLTRLDASGEARLVLRRSSRSRGGVCSLRQPDRGGHSGRHAAAHSGRRPQRRLRAELGAVLVLAEAILRGEDVGPLAAELPDAVRHRGQRLPVVARRASLPAATDRGRLPEHEGARRLAKLDAAGPEVGQGARGRRRLQPQRLGPATAGHYAGWFA